MKEAPCAREETCKATVGKRKGPGHHLCPQAAHERPTCLASHPYSEPTLVHSAFNENSAEQSLCL